MCSNCNTSERCECAGGTLSDACRCESGAACAVCNHVATRVADRAGQEELLLAFSESDLVVGLDWRTAARAMTSEAGTRSRHDRAERERTATSGVATLDAERSTPRDDAVWAMLAVARALSVQPTALSAADYRAYRAKQSEAVLPSALS